MVQLHHHCTAAAQQREVVVARRDARRVVAPRRRAAHREAELVLEQLVGALQGCRGHEQVEVDHRAQSDVVVHRLEERCSLEQEHGDPDLVQGGDHSIPFELEDEVPCRGGPDLLAELVLDVGRGLHRPRSLLVLPEELTEAVPPGGLEHAVPLRRAGRHGQRRPAGAACDVEEQRVLGADPQRHRVRFPELDGSW